MIISEDYDLEYFFLVYSSLLYEYILSIEFEIFLNEFKIINWK